MTSVVSDAGLLIAFAQIERRDLSRRLFDEVAIPPVVAAEVAPDAR